MGGTYDFMWFVLLEEHCAGVPGRDISIGIK